MANYGLYSGNTTKWLLENSSCNPDVFIFRLVCGSKLFT